jgi:hypothetical protein
MDGVEGAGYIDNGVGGQAERAYSAFGAGNAEEVESKYL